MRALGSEYFSEQSKRKRAHILSRYRYQKILVREIKMTVKSLEQLRFSSSCAYAAWNPGPPLSLNPQKGRSRAGLFPLKTRDLGGEAPGKIRTGKRRRGKKRIQEIVCSYLIGAENIVQFCQRLLLVLQQERTCRARSCALIGEKSSLFPQIFPYYTVNLPPLKDLIERGSVGQRGLVS